MLTTLTLTPADVERLEKAAAGLSDVGIRATLMSVGVPAGEGLAGVPAAKVHLACSVLAAALRVDPIEPATPEDLDRDSARRRFEERQMADRAAADQAYRKAEREIVTSRRVGDEAV